MELRHPSDHPNYGLTPSPLAPTSSPLPLRLRTAKVMAAW